MSGPVISYNDGLDDYSESVLSRGIGQHDCDGDRAEWFNADRHGCVQSNGVQIGSARLDGSGVALFDYSWLPSGTENLTAVYQGSGNFARSTSNTVCRSSYTRTTTVTSTPNPSTGPTVTITATVAPGLQDRRRRPAPSASLPMARPSPAARRSRFRRHAPRSAQRPHCRSDTDTIVATYSGDSNYAPSSGTRHSDRQSRRRSPGSS